MSTRVNVVFIIIMNLMEYYFVLEKETLWDKYHVNVKQTQDDKIS